MAASRLSRLSRWHRTLALLVVLPLLAWSLTGLLHPLMARWQPSAAAMMAPSELINAPTDRRWQDLPSPASVLPAALLLHELRPLTWQNEAYWMGLAADGTRSYFRARDGQLSDIEPALMTALARHFTGITSGEPAFTLITRFSDEYPLVNRYLPVWRVAFSGHDTVAFIEPRGLRLAALSDPWKTWFSARFSQLHSWSFWSHEPSRDAAMAVVLSLGLVVVVTGLLRLLRPMPSRHDSPHMPPAAPRRWHRRLGWVVALGALASMSSGLFHVLAINKSQPSFRAQPERSAFSASQVHTLPPSLGEMGERFVAVASPAPVAGFANTADTASGSPLWLSYAIRRGQSGEHTAHQHQATSAGLTMRVQRADTGQAVAVARYVQALAADVMAQHPGAAVLEQSAITGFTPEYGFVQKRLPVYRLSLDTANHLAIYVDPIDAVVSSVVTDLARAEGMSFAYLHKALWLDGLGKDTRDALLGVQALGVFAMAALGLWLARRRRLG